LNWIKVKGRLLINRPLLSAFGGNPDIKPTSSNGPMPQKGGIPMNQQQSNSRSTPRKIALALQGGGSHGAFTWGVLDRMLEDETIEIIGVTGTSAGAMNAVVLADGMVRGGRQQARKELRQFWEAIGKMVGFNSFLIWPMSGETAANTPLEHNPFYMAFAMLSRSLSPYDLNPLN
jgi:NTE family protein